MPEPALDVGAILGRCVEQFPEALAGLTAARRRAVADLSACRTARLGGRIEQCSCCGCREYLYNSCRNRHCPKCQGSERAAWLEREAGYLLPVEYHHLVFTLPRPLAPLARHNPRLLYGLLFAAAGASVQAVAANPKHLGAQVGLTAVLHTWGQTLSLHPHLHVLATGGRASEATIRNLTDPLRPPADQRACLDLLRELHAEQSRRNPGDAELEAVVRSYELAWRMQQFAPDVLDLSRETRATQRLYGIGEPATDTFGRQCLMARRLCEAGVRFVQVTYGDNTANPAWDQHSNLPRHAGHARAVDRPIAGLLADLKRRGLLEDTLVWWGSEFGRTPYAEKNGTGRDHNPGGFTVWLAGGGVRAGFAHGQTDDYGHLAVEDKVHMHDLHATILDLLGLDHERLTYRYSGRDFRLTDVHGRVVKEIQA
jgi:hypothetical protein